MSHKRRILFQNKVKVKQMYAMVIWVTKENISARNCIVFILLFYFSLPHKLGRSLGHHGWIRNNPFPSCPVFSSVLFSAALTELEESIRVHYLILSFHLFFCLPLLSFPFTVPFRIVFAQPEDLEPSKFPFLDQGQEIIIISNGCLDLSANFLIGNIVLVRNI